MSGKTEFEKKKERHASGESTMSTDSVTNYIPTPPDGGYGWVIVFASFLNHVIVDGIAFTFGIFFGAFMDYFKESSNRTALIGSIMAGCYLLSGAVASALVNRFGCRPVCIAGSLLATSGFLLSTLAPTLNWLYLTYGVMGGCGLGLIYLPSVISVSYYFQRRRAIATGIAVCGAGVGCFIFAPAGRVLLQHYDWKNAMVFVAGITLNACICGMLMKPLENPRGDKVREKNVLDRLIESARIKMGRNRSNSESSNCAHGVKADNNEILQRVQEVKLAREQMLREDESESEMSYPNSVMNSVRLLDGSRSPSRKGSDITDFSPRGSTIPRISIQGEDLIERSNEDITDAEDEGGPGARDIPDIPEDETVPLKKVAFEGASSPRMQNGFAKPTNGHAKMNGTAANGKANGTCTDADVTQNGLAVPENGLGGAHKATSACEVTDFFLQMPRRRHTKPSGVHKVDYSRPMYRKDIFYSGSLLHVQEFRSQPNMRSYMRSVTSIPAAVPPEKESKMWRCLPIPKVAKDTLKSMLDVSLFLDPVFLIACLGNAFGFIGLFVPFIFAPQRAMSLGISETKAAFLLSVIGITNTTGRILAGWLADRPGVNPLLLHNLAIVFGGVACILNMFATNYAGMCIFCAFFGFCVATWISLTSIILCNLLGLQKLTNAFGLLTMTRGISSIAGPPLAGYMYDTTNNYDAAFHLGGGVLVVSGLLFCLLHLPYFRRVNTDPELGGLEDQTIADIPDDILLDNEFSDNIDSSELDKDMENAVFDDDKEPRNTASSSNQPCAV